MNKKDALPSTVPIPKGDNYPSAEDLITGKWLHQDQVMKILGIMYGALYNYRKKHNLLSRKIGKQVYFLASDLDAFIEKGTDNETKRGISVSMKKRHASNKHPIIEETNINHWDKSGIQMFTVTNSKSSLNDTHQELRIDLKESDKKIVFNMKSIELIRTGQAKLLLIFNPIIFDLGVKVLTHCFPNKDIGFLETCIVLNKNDAEEIVHLEDCFREVESI